MPDDQPSVEVGDEEVVPFQAMYDARLGGHRPLQNQENVSDADKTRAAVNAAAPAIVAKVVEGKDAEIARLREELDEAARQRQDRTREMVERLCPYVKEQYGVAELAAHSAALCEREVSRAEKAEAERDQATQKERERLKARALAKSDEFIAAYWGTGAEPTETFRASVRAALDAWLDAALDQEDDRG